MVKLIATGGVGLASLEALPRRWTKPVVDAVILPVHAQASPGVVPTGRLYGTSRDGELFRIDTTTGAGTLVAAMAANSTEIEFNRATGRAWSQQRDGTFTITEFNILTGALIGGPVGTGAAFNGLEFVGSALYGTAITSGGGPSTLRTLDPVTGISNVIGPTGVNQISGIAYRTAGAGAMFGIAGGAGAPAVLYRLNLSTGAATAVGTTSITAGSLAFAGGVLYAGGDATDGGNLYMINQVTGASTLVGPTGFDSVTGLTYT
jgi:hypothetical protein